MSGAVSKVRVTPASRPTYSRSGAQRRANLLAACCGTTPKVNPSAPSSDQAEGAASREAANKKQNPNRKDDRLTFLPRKAFVWAVLFVPRPRNFRPTDPTPCPNAGALISGHFPDNDPPIIGPGSQYDMQIGNRCAREGRTRFGRQKKIPGARKPPGIPFSIANRQPAASGSNFN